MVVIWEPAAGLFIRQYRISRPRTWPRRLGGSLTPEIDGFHAMTLYLTKKKDFFWLLICQTQNKAAFAASDILVTVLSRLDNPILVSRPTDYAPCANLDEEEVSDSVLFHFSPPFLTNHSGSDWRARLGPFCMHNVCIIYITYLMLKKNLI